MNPITRYTFEGAELTAPEVQKLVPVYSYATVLKYLRAGATTKIDMHRLAEQNRRKITTGGRRGGKAGTFQMPFRLAQAVKADKEQSK
jgi:hypothetical protein